MLFLLVLLLQMGYTGLEGCGKSLMTEYKMDAFDFAFVRNLVTFVYASALARHKHLSLRGGVGARNWKPLVLNGITGVFAMVLTSYVFELLPLTIWFVILCTMPFVIAIFSYFYMGERMSPISILAAVLSFGAILMLCFAKPQEPRDSEAGSSAASQEDGEDESYNYVLGVILSVICVMMISTTLLTTRSMQEVNSILIMKTYNLFSTVIIGTVMLIRWPATGRVPFTMVWTRQSVVILLLSIVSHLVAQQTMFYVNQKAQPAIVTLMSYIGIALRLIVDMLIFDLVPNQV